MAGDATLFQRSDMVEAGWNVIQAHPGRLARFARPAVSRTMRQARGSIEADDLLERDGARGGASAKRKSTTAADCRPG